MKTTFRRFTAKDGTEKNHGLPESGEVDVTPGVCPCSVCGHKTMEECEKADCKCCTSVCN